LAEEHTPSPQQPKQVIVRFTWSREKATKAIPNPEPDPSTSKRPEPDEEAQAIQSILVYQTSNFDFLDEWDIPDPPWQETLMTMGDYRGQFDPAQEVEQAKFWIGQARTSVGHLNHNRKIIVELLGCFLTLTMSAVRELKREWDEKAVQITNLEEKVANLNKDCRELLQEQVGLKNESKAIKKEHEDTQRELQRSRWKA
jgi:hypothetical protein